MKSNNSKSLEQLKAEYIAILDKAKDNNRSLNAAEAEVLGELQDEIRAVEAEHAESARKAVVAKEQHRSSAAAANLSGAISAVNEQFRSVTKGALNIGDVTFVQPPFLTPRRCIDFKHMDISQTE